MIVCILRCVQIACFIQFFFSYKVPVRVCDSRGDYEICATATVVINIRRNLFSPEFVNQPYREPALRNDLAGKLVLSVSAEDDDQRVSFLWT